MGKYFKQKVKRGSAKSVSTKKNKPKKERKPINIRLLITIVGIVALIIIFIAIVVLLLRNAKKEQLEPYDTINVDINSKMPEAKDFFKTYKNVNEDNIEIDYGNLDVNVPGEYEITITYGNDHKKEVVIVYVDDYTAPDAVFKNLEIKENEKYALTDFQEKCTDNYSKCTIEYVNPEDANITKVGIHKIKIKAYDDNKNEFIQEVTLTIKSEKEETTPKTVKCEYGNLEVNPNDKDIPILYYVGDQESGCALNPKGEISEDLKNKLQSIANKDIELAHKDIDKKIKDKYIENTGMIVYPYFKAIYNNDGKGIIGYAVRIEMYAGSTSNLKEMYYIKGDGTRYYLTNEYKLS